MSDAPPDRALAAGSPDEHGGSTQDFKQQMVATIPALRGFARGLCGNRDEADDLAQEAMVRAWAARHTFTPGTNFKAWIFVILRNHFYTTRRKQARISAWDPEAMERVLVTPATQHVGIDLADVERALARLPVEQREMLMLVATGSMSYEDAATVTGCALGTVKSRVFRGRAALARMLDPQDDEPFDGEGGVLPARQALRR